MWVKVVERGQGTELCTPTLRGQEGQEEPENSERVVPEAK